MTSSTEKDDRAARELSNSSTPFLKLPPEIRNHIYSDLLPSDEICDISGEIKYEIRPSNSKPDKKAFVKTERASGEMLFEDPLAIARCCRQLRSEVLRFHFGFNSYVLPVAPEEIEQTSKWLQALPSEAWSVMRTVYLHQTMRRCHRNRLPWYERLLSIDLKTLEVVIIGKLRHCSGCLERYERQIERVRERRTFKELKAQWSESKLSHGRLMELARLFQRRPNTTQDDKDDPLTGLVLMFDDL